MMNNEANNDDKEKTENLLDDALARGVISDEQRTALAGMTRADDLDQDERIQTVGKFNEIFMTLGVAILLFAVNGLLLIPFSEMVSLVMIIVATLGVGEYFHRHKRHRLPIIYCVLCAAFLATGLIDKLNVQNSHALSADFADFTQLCVAVTLLTLGATRFRIPFLMLPIMVLSVFAVTTLADIMDATTSIRLLLGGSGLAILAVAIRFDLKDPTRTARASDFAFWSYMVGSPLFVHALLLPVVVDNMGQTGELALHYWLLLVVLIAIITFAGLLMNRRALIISTMAYVAFVIAYFLIKQEITSPQTGLLATLATIGAYMLFLGAKWSHFRRALLSKLAEKFRFVQYLPRY